MLPSKGTEQKCSVPFFFALFSDGIRRGRSALSSENDGQFLVLIVALVLEWSPDVCLACG